MSYSVIINENLSLLPGITGTSTGYEYGLALAEAVKPYVADHKAAKVTVDIHNTRIPPLLQAVG